MMIPKIAGLIALAQKPKARKPCTSCDNTGTCGICGGSGKTTMFDRISDCPACGGSGSCAGCGGVR